MNFTKIHKLFISKKMSLLYLFNFILVSFIFYIGDYAFPSEIFYSFLILVFFLNILSFLFINTNDKKIDNSEVIPSILIGTSLYLTIFFTIYSINDVKFGPYEKDKVFLKSACLTSDASSENHMISAETYGYGRINFKFTGSSNNLISFFDCLKADGNINLRRTIISNNKVIRVEINKNYYHTCVNHAYVQKRVNLIKTLKDFNCMQKPIK